MGLLEVSTRQIVIETPVATDCSTVVTHFSTHDSEFDSV